MSLFLAVWLAVQSAFAMPAPAYDSLRSQVDDEAFADDQIAVLRTAASTNTFTPAQVAGLLEEMSFADDKLAALRVLAPRMEAGDHSVIIGEFTFDDDKRDAQSILSSTTRVATAAVPAPAPTLGRATQTVVSQPVGPKTPNCPVDPSLPALEVNWSSAWSDAEFAGLIAELEAASFSSDRMSLLQQRVQNRPEGLTGAQVLQLLATFDFSSDLEAVVQALDEHLLGMKVAEVRQILDAYSFSDGKLAALTVLKDTITDAEHKHQLLDAFTFSADKEKAAALLEDITPRSFLFGTVNSQRAVFVVDTSGSMEATFRNNQGRSMSRLDFVRCELDSVLTQQLGPNADFSIVTFSSAASGWRDRLVDATPPLVSEARSYVANMYPRGGTNIDSALRTAIAMNPDVIYFLTDGAPTAGQERSAAGLVRLAQTGGHPVHAIAFLTGSHRSDDKAASRALMRSLAEGTGGVYRAIE